MKLFMSKSLEFERLQSEHFSLDLDYHPAKGWYKIIYQGLILADLPAPLHYFNFKALTGQPNIPILRNSLAITSTPLNTVSILTSVSSKMRNQIQSYEKTTECDFQYKLFQFGQENKIEGDFPKFRLHRVSKELSVDLNIETLPLINYLNRFKIGVYEHWSLMCHCQGVIQYEDKTYEIEQLGTFEFAKLINLPYVPLYFYVYQVIQLKNAKQLLFIHVKDHLNRIVQSKVHIRCLDSIKTISIDRSVEFNILRIYPKIKTPDGQEMYLPREFEWEAKSDNYQIQLLGISRGDYKFGLGAGYVGSFSYQVVINGEPEFGEGGYCEYIDVRPLLWQEEDENEKNKAKMSESILVSLKNKVDK